MKKINILFYITIILLIALPSCVKTESDTTIDPVTPPDPDNPAVTLTREYLNGEWVLFYNNKLFKNNQNESLGTNYRYPDIEGRRLTYDLQGNYTEENAWGDTIYSSGKYNITLKAASKTGYDQITYTPDYDYEKDLSPRTFNYPLVTKNYFDRYNDYVATNTTTKKQYYISDTWYFRKADSDYLLPNKKMGVIELSSLLGTWRFIGYNYFTNSTAEVKSEYQELIDNQTAYTFYSDYTFKRNNSKNSTEVNGDYFILDDIVQTKWPAIVIDKKTNQLKDTIYTQLFWIKDGIKTTSTGTTFVQYYKSRDPNDLQNVITQENTYKKIE